MTSPAPLTPEARERLRALAEKAKETIATCAKDSGTPAQIANAYYDINFLLAEVEVLQKIRRFLD